MASPPSPAPSHGQTRPRRHPTSGARRSNSPLDPRTAAGAALASAHSPSSGTAGRMSMRRLAALHGTEDRVVLDIGTRITVAGFSGEARPRAIVRSSVPPLAVRTAVACPGASPAFPSSTVLNAAAAPGPKPEPWDGHWSMADQPLWAADMSRLVSDKERTEAQHLLEARIEELLRYLYSDVLMIDARTRPVVLVDWPSTPAAVSSALVRVLEGILRVPSVSFVPAPLMAMLSSGRVSGLVVDASGGEETRISAIAWGRGVALSPAAAQDQQSFVAQPLPLATPRGGQRVKDRLRALLVRYARLVSRPSTGEGKTVSKVPESLLTESVMDQLVSRICLVAPLDHTRPPTFTPSDPELEPRADESEKDYACRLLAHRYGPRSPQLPGTTRTTAAVVPLASLQGWQDWVRARQGAPPPAPPPSSTSGRTSATTASATVDGPVPPRVSGMGAFANVWGGSAAGIPLRQARTEPGLPALPPPPGSASALGLKSLFAPLGVSAQAHWSGSTQLLVPGWVRERAVDVLFEMPSGGWGDPEDPPVQWLVLDALRCLPVDLRKPLGEQILVLGGLAMLPNFTHRLAQEVVWSLLHLPPPRSLGPARRARTTVPDPDEREREKEKEKENERGSSGLLPPQRSSPAKTRPPSRIEVLYSGLKPLVDHVGVLNDWGAGQPFGPALPSGRRASVTPRQTEAPSSGPLPPLPPSTAGSAPALPANILPWIGASLSGALQLASRRAVSKEEWDASVMAAREAAGRAQAVGESPGPAPAPASVPAAPVGQQTPPVAATPGA